MTWAKAKRLHGEWFAVLGDTKVGGPWGDMDGGEEDAEMRADLVNREIAKIVKSDSNDEERALDVAPPGRAAPMLKPCPFDTQCIVCKTLIGVSRSANGRPYCDDHHPRSGVKT